MIRYYDREGNPITIEEWSSAYEDVEGRSIGNDTVEGQQVSTVWRGLDRTEEGPPLIFETMIFGGPRDQYCERYSTEQDALAGQQRIVAALQGGELPVIRSDSVE